MESYSDWLAHFGIEGMKWGRRNGPPYPLSSRQMSKAERKQNKVRAKEYTKALNEKARNYAVKAYEANRLAGEMFRKELGFRAVKAQSNKITLPDGTTTYLVKKEDEDNFKKEIAPIKEQYDKARKEVEAGREEVSRLLKEIGNTDMRIYLDVNAYNTFTGQEFYKRFEKSDILRFVDEGTPMPARANEKGIVYGARYKVKAPKKNKGG